MRFKHACIIILICLAAVGARTLMVWTWPNGYSPLAAALGFDRLWIGLFTVANLGLWVALATRGVTLGLYVRARPDDTIPARTLWSMSAGYILLASGCLARAVAVWIPIYWTWLFCDLLGLAVYGGAMLRLPAELRAFAQRRPYRELARIVAELEEAALQPPEAPPEVVLQTLHAQVVAFVGQMHTELAQSRG